MQVTIPKLCDFPFTLSITTRWSDNDVYGHVNNVIYYSWFDTIINSFLIKEAQLDIKNSSVIGICAESSCKYKKSVVYPDIIIGGLRVANIGNSSVRYEVGIFKEGEQSISAFGYFVHVFTDRETGRPVPIPSLLRSKLESIKTKTNVKANL
eukprot:TRINITY_DN2993_c0_g1_i2.p1 TRINITY_DN2993_c0_g1~~TRINITY_DN2993_c0_g1_i2.p1  ORF type:complete len:152 (+),score=18.13 TRINITY_DN2993_c0_g1_i2:42-497(+)